MIIEIHFIQNFAPSNLNRDDTNNPKDCVFGGVRRARISSQCLKRAIRDSEFFKQHGKIPVGKRSRWIAREIAKKIVESGRPIEESEKLSQILMAEFIGSMEVDKKIDQLRNKVLFFFSETEINTCVNFINKNWEEMLKSLAKVDDFEKYIKDVPKEKKDQKFKLFTNGVISELQKCSLNTAVDIAMFGRMLASNPIINIDAACQVAHAISTHSVAMDLDFFTAVDDLLKEGETGAGMMGVIGFNSACFYRYACVDVDQLTKNLNGDAALARSTVDAFLQASTYAIPSGKQNSFATHNPPTLLMAVVRQDGHCWSLANAFEKPVAAFGEKSLVQASIKALDSYWGKMNAFFGGQAKVVTALLEDIDNLEVLKDTRVATFQAWVEAVISQLPQE